MAQRRDDLGRPEAVAAAFSDSGALSLVLEGPDLVVAAASPALVDLVGGGRPLVGRAYRDTLADVLGPESTDLLGEVMRTGTTRTLRHHPADHPAEHPGEHPAEHPGEHGDDAGAARRRSVTLVLSPWLHDDGRVRGVVAHGLDVTLEVRERRRAEVESSAARHDEDAGELVRLLQDSLLPPALPVVPGLQSAARYVVGHDDLSAAGGDWVDEVLLPDHRVALVVGDVVGHGVAASALMGQLRAVLAERLHADDGLGPALAALDRFARRLPQAHAATVVVVVLDPVTGDLEYCTAGHPPPLVLGDEGPRFLQPSGAAPLASGGGFAVRRDHLDEGELLLLYSDGILERPGVAPTRATVELAETASRVMAAAAPAAAVPVADRVGERTIELLVGRTGFVDDIALVATQRVPVLAPFELVVPAEPPASREVRRGLRGWLEPLAMRAMDDLALQHAVGECVANGVEHAYRGRPDGPGDLHVRARLRPDGVVEVDVTDRGVWREPVDRPHHALDDHEHGARGLAMATQLVDRVALHTGPGGTTVRLELAVAREVVLLEGATPVDPADLPTAASDELTTVVEGPRLTASGALDLAGSDDLRIGLMRLVAGRHRRVVADLSGLTLLASAGVQVLFDARQRAADQGIELHVVAAPGTVAQHVLDLVQLPHEAPETGGPTLADLPPI